MSISLKLSELDTPSLLIDKAKLFENIDYCQRRAHELGVNWRPHVKTHKCAPIAAMQVQSRKPSTCSMRKASRTSFMP